MRSVRSANIQGKRVLVRVDFNILPLTSNEPRISKTIPTIKYLLRRGAEVVLLTHLETNDGRKPSTRVLKKYLRRFLPEQVVLFENLRQFPGEESGQMSFAKKLAKLGDLYVNEAFSVSHRKHASLVLLPRLLPAYCGFLFEEEVRNLSKVFNPPHPFTLVLGGAKPQTKFPLLRAFLPKVDKVLLGGNLVNLFLKKKLIKSNKIILPEKTTVKNGRVYDVLIRKGGEWEKIIKNSKLVVWNGPLGLREEGFTAGTKRLIAILKKARGKVIVGGGDTLDLLPKKLPKNIFVSTGGGAMLEYLAKGTLPGIKALEK